MKLIYFTVASLVLLSVEISAQKSVNPNFETHRLDFRDIGYPAATMIPADDSPISALLAHSNGKVYGATSGKKSYLFVYDPNTNKVYPLGKIPMAQGVHNSLVEGEDGLIYIGTGLNELSTTTLTQDIPYGRRTIENQLWSDIKNKYTNFEGGLIYAYDPSSSDAQVYLPESTAILVNLGIALPNNSIYTMTISRDKKKDLWNLVPRCAII